MSLQYIFFDSHPKPVRGQGWVTDGAGLVAAAPHRQRRAKADRAGPCPGCSQDQSSLTRARTGSKSRSFTCSLRLIYADKCLMP